MNVGQWLRMARNCLKLLRTTRNGYEIMNLSFKRPLPLLLETAVNDIAYSNLKFYNLSLLDSNVYLIFFEVDKLNFRPFRVKG
jgi:hypothetical protein